MGSLCVNFVLLPSECLWLLEKHTHRIPPTDSHVVQSSCVGKPLMIRWNPHTVGTFITTVPCLPQHSQLWPPYMSKQKSTYSDCHLEAPVRRFKLFMKHSLNWWLSLSKETIWIMTSFFYSVFFRAWNHRCGAGVGPNIVYCLLQVCLLAS